MKIMIDGVQYVPATPAPSGRGLADALAVRFDSDAGDDLTVRQYLFALIKTLWDEGESFSGKRPFGNSGWDIELMAQLAKAGFVTRDAREVERKKVGLRKARRAKQFSKR